MDIEKRIEQRKLELNASQNSRAREEQAARRRDQYINSKFNKLLTPEGLPIQDIDTSQGDDDGLDFLRMSDEAKNTLKGFVKSYLGAGLSPPYIEQGWTRKGSLFSAKRSYGTHGWLMPIGRLSKFYEPNIGPDDHTFLPAIITPRYTLALPLTRFVQKTTYDSDDVVCYSEDIYMSTLRYFRKNIGEISPASDIDESHVSYKFISDIAINGVVNRLAQTGVSWKDS